MSFVIRQLNEASTLGEKLHAMRKAANRTLSEMAECTKIQKSYLKAFEEGRYDLLPEPLYSRQFLKRYVRRLGGDPAYFLQCFEKERGTCDLLDQSRIPSKKLRILRFFTPVRLVKAAGFLLLLGAIGGYVSFQINGLISPPEIAVNSPADGLIVGDANIQISGSTEEEVTLVINEEQVLLDEGGNFQADIPLERGLNVIEISAKKRYSQETTVYRRVLLEPSQATARR